MDIIALSRCSACGINSEDGSALADAALRAELAALLPSAWSRSAWTTACCCQCPSTFPVGHEIAATGPTDQRGRSMSGIQPSSFHHARTSSRWYCTA
jgi:hypothetical protein